MINILALSSLLILFLFIIDSPFEPLVNKTFLDHPLLIIIFPHLSAKLLLLGYIFVALSTSFELGVIKNDPLYFSKLLLFGSTIIILFFTLRLTTPVELRRVLKVFVTTFFCSTFNYPC